VWQGKCPSIPDEIEEVIRKRAPHAVRIALETGPLCVWHWHALRSAGLPIICIHARHAKAGLMMQLNKTDQGDAYGPERFSRAKDVGAYLGLTPRRYQSGEVDRNGRVSKCGDAMLRALLFEAAHALLTRARHKSVRGPGGLRSQKEAGRQTKVAVARKLTVVMHRMWSEGTPFRRSSEIPAAA
jgi:transposase